MGLCLCGEGQETKRPPGRGGRGVFSPSPFSPCSDGWEESCLHDRISGGDCFLFRFLPWLLYGPWRATTKVEHIYEIHGPEAC